MVARLPRPIEAASGRTAHRQQEAAALLTPAWCRVPFCPLQGIGSIKETQEVRPHYHSVAEWLSQLVAGVQRTWGWHARLAKSIEAPTPTTPMQGSQPKPPAMCFPVERLALTPLALLQMLDFCGKHNVTCDIELIKVDYVNEAMVRCQGGLDSWGRDGTAGTGVRGDAEP